MSFATPNQSRPQQQPPLQSVPMISNKQLISHPPPIPPQNVSASGEPISMNKVVFLSAGKLNLFQSEQEKQGKYGEANREEQLKEKETKEQEKLTMQEAEKDVRDEILEAHRLDFRVKTCRNCCCFKKWF